MPSRERHNARMPATFFVPSSSISADSRVLLPQDEARHAVRVLRKKRGDEVCVVTGEGVWYRVCLEEVTIQRVTGHIVETRADVGEPSYHLSIGLALLKNRSRFETFLEKAVELGVSEIIPLETSRTETSLFRQARARHIMISAMKQCGRSRLTRLRAPEQLLQLLEAPAWNTAFLAHEQADPAETLAEALRGCASHARLRILVGPEGGFTDNEVLAAENSGYRVVSLGPRRLRAETAALSAAATVMMSMHTPSA